MLCYTLYLYPNPFFLYLKSKPLLIGYTLVGLLQPSGIDTFFRMLYFLIGMKFMANAYCAACRNMIAITGMCNVAPKSQWLNGKNELGSESAPLSLPQWLELGFSVFSRSGRQRKWPHAIKLLQTAEKRCKVSNWLVSSKGWISNWIYRADIVMECDWSSCSCHVCDIVIYEWFSEQVLIESKRIN